MLERADILRSGVGVILLAGVLATWSGRTGCGGVCRIVECPPAPTESEPRLRSTPIALEQTPAGGRQARGASPTTVTIAAIERDYTEITAEVSNRFSETTGSPDGLNTFLRQLVLVRHEHRADLARVFTPRELEDYELRESAAGKIVQELLDGTSATEEQRRNVFRLQAAFEESFGLNFDFSPTGNYMREKARVQLQENIQRVLGDELFLAWLAGEGTGPGLSASSPQQNLSPTETIELWRANTALNLRRLQLVAAENVTPEQLRVAYARAVRESKIRTGVGPAQ